MMMVKCHSIATESNLLGPLVIEPVPELRIRSVNCEERNPDGKWVLYWMTAFRRSRYNFALEHAVRLANELKRPLLVLEALRVRYRWASDRMHRFIIEGMRDNALAFADTNALYHPYVEPKPGAGRGLVHALAADACAIVTDDYPCFFHPKLIRLVSRKTKTSFEAVDSNCLMPLAHAERTFTVAHSYRRWMQKELPQHLEQLPEREPLSQLSVKQLPAATLRSITKRWPAANAEALLGEGGLEHLSIDHSVPAGAIEGGGLAADRLLSNFLNQRLEKYNEDRNVPDKLGSSELSPHLHFGHISPHEIFLRLMEQERWTPGKLNKPNGKMNGFWGVREEAEAFLDQLCTWREIGFNMCWRERNYEQFSSLPDWAQNTLEEHASDRREHIYTLEQFEQAQTHDPIWNAAQRQLVHEGRIHNYLRMLWGKKILHWTQHPREALAIMIELNNKYALDGRDPNSYSGIFWVLGRYDRAWGPERPIFGKIRYMTSENTAKKHKLKQYVERFAE